MYVFSLISVLGLYWFEFKPSIFSFNLLMFFVILEPDL